MIKLNLPPYPARVTEDQGKAKILDVLRRRYVALTPEEWVRQHLSTISSSTSIILRRYWPTRCD